ncbi:MAG: ATP-binding cassette domain-containing protein [Deltaproteobacteria bacterium]|nr:ATP-binding cassette domain-containing protein [Deltaproteobacteria bacterium]NIS77569.1 ATP-binding cassette domain-containing protein [Deltaproteobacteria bacterium]
MMKPIIKIRDLHKSFGINRVLQGVNLDIFKGENMVVIGGSGSGKSVLIKCVIGLLKPDAGSISVDGVDVTKITEEEMVEVRKKFGMLFQGAALFDSLTVGENVAFELKRLKLVPAGKLYQIVEEKLSLVGLRNIQHLMPSELSGGMKKRVGLARAIASEPEILLYDEPTTGLDPIMADVINELVISMKSILNVTSISITHDMTSAYKIGDKIAMLYNGKIVEVGTPDEVRSSENPIVRQFIEGRAEGPITEESEEFVKFDTKPAEPLDRRK